MPKMIKKFRPRILSRHPSHNILRSRFKTLPLNGFRCIVRFGSLTKSSAFKVDIPIEVNTVKAIENSSSKRLMKECFNNAGVKSSRYNVGSVPDEFHYPIVAKKIYGSRGRGMQYLTSKEDYDKLDKKKNYIFEEYFSGVKEYRIHVTEDGYFYACRKMLKRDTPDDKRYFKNDSNSVWIREDSESNNFDKPVNWNVIVSHCVKSLKSCGLDFGACDVRVQSSTDKEGNKRKDPDFRIIEINSAPSFGEKEMTTLNTYVARAYAEMLPKLINKKIKQLNGRRNN